jgi:hypothetical protein
LPGTGEISNWPTPEVDGASKGRRCAKTHSENMGRVVPLSIVLVAVVLQFPSPSTASSSSLHDISALDSRFRGADELRGFNGEHQEDSEFINMFKLLRQAMLSMSDVSTVEALRCIASLLQMEEPSEAGFSSTRSQVVLTELEDEEDESDCVNEGYQQASKELPSSFQGGIECLKSLRDLMASSFKFLPLKGLVSSYLKWIM